MHYGLASRHNFASFRSCDFYWDERWQNNKRVYKDFFVNVVNVYHIYGIVLTLGMVGLCSYVTHVTGDTAWHTDRTPRHLQVTNDIYRQDDVIVKKWQISHSMHSE